MKPTLAATVGVLILTGCAVQPGPSSPELSRPTAAATSLATEEPTSPAATEHLPTLPNLCRQPGELMPGALARANRDTVTHSGPGRHYDPTGSAEATTGERLPDAYRVVAGDRVVVEEGPLRIGDVDWFLLYSAEVRGEGNLGAIVPTSASWAPARDEQGPLFEPIGGIDAQCAFVAAGGPGRGMVTVPEARCPGDALCASAALAWAAAPPPGGECRLVMTDTDSRQVVIDAELTQWSSGASWWREAESRLLVDTDCTWSVRTAEG